MKYGPTISSDIADHTFMLGLIENACPFCPPPTSHTFTVNGAVQEKNVLIGESQLQKTLLVVLDCDL